MGDGVYHNRRVTEHVMHVLRKKDPLVLKIAVRGEFSSVAWLAGRNTKKSREKAISN